MNAARIRQNAVDALKSVTPLSTRRRLVRARLKTREATSNLRTLPDFLILGGQRCGTSSLFKYLSRHPEIAPSLRKEVEYFTIEYGKGEGWYRAHFPTELRRTVAERRGRQFTTFEATPDYLFDPRAPRRAAELVPHAKCVIILRDPVERAYSHYHHNLRLGQETLSFADAVAAEDERLASDRVALIENPHDRVLNFRRFSYLSRGEYADQISRWFEHYPRDLFLVLMADDLFGQPEETLHKLLRFVGVRAWSPPEFRNYSYTTAIPSTNAEIPEELEAQLRERYAPHDEKLAALLDFRLPWTEH